MNLTIEQARRIWREINSEEDAEGGTTMQNISKLPPGISEDDFFCEFTSFSQWVNKAGSWLGGVSGGGVRHKRPEKNIVCFDTAGRRCKIGRDFMLARDENTFPVRCYKVTKRLADELDVAYRAVMGESA